MTTTITKRAEELKPGDVLTRALVFGPAVVCRVEPSDVPDRLRVTHFNVHRNEMDYSYYSPDDEKAIEPPALSPAQQHAEELLGFVRKIAASDYAQADEEAREVLAKIDPPAPPTLEEALTTIAKLKDVAIFGGWSDDIARQTDGILDRARRSGILKA